jgi:acyl-CoA thioester hydrolase
MSVSNPIDPLRDALPAAPLDLPGQRVLPEWIDYNGHMNVAYYVLAFDKATDRLFDLLDLGADYAKRTSNSSFVLETHVTYAQEVHEGDPLRFTAQLLDYDAKRLHYFLQMFHAEEGYLSATSEQIALHVSLDTRRTAPIPPDQLARLSAVMAAHQGLAKPRQAGSVIGIRRKVA